MAYRNLSVFQPIGLDRIPVQAVINQSAIEFAASRRQMATASQRVPAIGSVASSVIPRGEFYPEDTGTDTTVLLEATKFGQAVPVTDEDLADALAYFDAQNSYGVAWANSHAIELDNACLGVLSGPGVPETTVPFTSVYATAGISKIASSAAGLDDDDIIAWLGAHEEGNGYSAADTVIIAHPRFKTVLLQVTNSVTGAKVFGSGNTDLTGTGPFAAVSRRAAILKDYPVLWTRGAITSATATETEAVSLGAAGTAGNPLMIVANRNNLLLGVPKGVAGPEFKEERIPGKDVVEFMFRSRRAFTLGSAASASVLELTS
jgi:hypothetical protein